MAPEPGFVKIFSQAAGKGYVTADLYATNAMEKMDISAIDYPDNSFDIIYCSHVLEHVLDDRKAMREFYRTLAPHGWAIFNVPITASETFEDPSITDPDERFRLFGQEDHLRRYGPDYADRLTAAGFTVTKYCCGDVFSAKQLIRNGASNGAAGDIFYCEKNVD